MKILLFDAGTAEGVSLGAALRSLGHDVVITFDASHPLQGVGLVLVWLDPASPLPNSLLVRLRSSVPAQLPLRAASPLGSVFDDLIPWPADVSQLAARLAPVLYAGALGRLAHDYNNILTAIQGHAELTLLNAHLDSNVRLSLSQIHSSALRAIDLNRQLQTWSASAAPPRPAVAAQPPKGTILLIDADDALRHAAHRSLRRAGFVVFEVSSPAEGLDLMAQIGPALDAVVIDPHSYGPPDSTIVHDLFRLRPRIHLVFWSGASEEELRSTLPAGAAFFLAPKPHADALIGALAQHPVA